MAGLKLCHSSPVIFLVLSTYTFLFILPLHVTSAQQYYLERARPVYVLEENASEETDPMSAEANNDRARMDLISSEDQLIGPSSMEVGRMGSIELPDNFDEEVNKNIKFQRTPAEPILGDPGRLHEGDEDGIIPEGRILWPISVEIQKDSDGHHHHHDDHHGHHEEHHPKEYSSESRGFKLGPIRIQFKGNSAPQQQTPPRPMLRHGPHHHGPPMPQRRVQHGPPGPLPPHIIRHLQRIQREKQQNRQRQSGEKGTSKTSSKTKKGKGRKGSQTSSPKANLRQPNLRHGHQKGSFRHGHKKGHGGYSTQLHFVAGHPHGHGGHGGGGHGWGWEEHIDHEKHKLKYEILKLKAKKKIAILQNKVELKKLLSLLHQKKIQALEWWR